MPEGVAKEGKEDAKGKAKEASPRRRPAGNIARVRVELLDGSIMELDVDRKIRGQELLGKVCDKLNLVEKDYFGLLYEDRGDPRVWVDLEKRVSKMLKHEPWSLRFSVKFYPPEPAQLQEELTRYQLVLAVRKDLLEGRLPCSTVTHALLASYLLQSELGDQEPGAAPDAGLCKQLKLVPAAAATKDLEEKVMELHKTHRGQTPAEAELNYLENAKKLAMYGVDLHPAKDSENVDITLGVCSSGLLVHREKLRINRFAWPKILKISYKRHNFYVKLRPGEFEQFESTVGFKLANHRAAKKLWKTCVEHHTFFRLMSPEPASKSTLFPRLGSRFRYSGRTHYESRAAPPQRPPPHFARTLSNRKLSSRSMDALAQGDKDESMPADAAKRHTMPPQPAPRPTIKDKKPPPGAVKVMPTAPDKKDEKKVLEQRKPAENGTDTTSDPGITNNVETTPKKSKTGGFGLFGGRNKSPKEEKSPKEKSPKEKSPKTKDKKVKDPKIKVAALETSNDSSNLDSSLEKSPAKGEDKPSFTKPYEYNDTERSPTRTKPFIQGAFSYEKEPLSDERQRALDDSQSPTTRKAGLAFNYAPGEDKKVAESAEKRKTPEDPSKLKTPGLDYVQSAALKEQAKNLIDPTLALLDSERSQHEVPSATVVPVLAAKPDNEIQVVIITGRYNPKSKKLDDANGTILVTKGSLNKANGKIQTDKELINTKSGQVSYTDPATGKQEVKNGHVDKTGHILFTSGVIDPKTGKIDPSLAQQYCFVERSPDKLGAKPGREVDLVVITGKYDGKNKKLDASHGHVDVSRAVVGPDGYVASNYGVIDPRTGKIEFIHPKTGKEEPKQAYVDQKTGNILVTTAVLDPKSGKVDSSLGQQFSIVEKDATKANREVRLVVVTSKYDLKTKKLDPTFAHVDSVKGVLSGTDGKIYTEYGIIDPRTGEIQVTDSKTGKQEIKHATVDPKTGNILLLSGVIDPRTGQLDTSLGQQYSIVDKPIDTFGATTGKEVQVVAITGKYDSKSKKLDNPNGFIETSHAIISDKDGKVHSNFGVLDPNNGKVYFTDPKTGKRDSKQAVVDAKTGSFILTSGVIDPKTGKSDSSLAQQLTVVDKDAPKGIPERYANLVVVTSKYDPKTKKLDITNAHVDSFPGKYDNDDKVHTDFGIVDPATGDIIVTDPITGKQEVKKAAIDPKTGNLLLTSGVVDPNTGKLDPALGQQITVVDKPKDTFPSVAGKEVQLVVITSKYDSKYKRLDSPNGHVETSRGIVAADGKVHTNFGVIDPKTGKIDHVDPKSGKQEIKQAVADPKTGHLVISSGVVDPKTGKVDSSLAQQFAIVDKDRVAPERYVNLVIVTSKYDLKNKKLDLTNAHVDSIPGKVGADNKVHTAFGVVDPNTGNIIVADPHTGKQEIKKASVDPKTGNLLLTSSVVDPVSGHVDPTLGQQISIVEKPKDQFANVPGKEVQLVVITSKYDPRTKKLDNPNGHVETSRGIIAPDGRVHTNFGIIDTKSGKIDQIDPKTGKHETKQAIADPQSGHLLLTSGVVDPKTGKADSSLAQQFAILDKDAPKERYVNLVIVTTKYDPKNKKLDLTNAHVDSVPGKVGADGKVHTEFGEVDTTTGDIVIKDPVTGRRETKVATVDSKTGNLLLTSGVVDPQTGQVDPNLGQQISVVDRPKDTFTPVPGREVQLVIITSKYDLKNKKLDSPNGHIETSRGIVGADGRVHTNYGIIDPKTGKIELVDPKTGKHETKQAVADPGVGFKSGNLILTTGVVDPKTGKPDSTLAQQFTIVEKETKPVEREIHLVIITTKYDPRTRRIDPSQGHVDTISGVLGADGRIRTAIGIVDPATGEIVVTDPKTGRQEVKRAQVHPETGHMIITNNVVDPKTGRVDPTLVQQYSVVNKPVVPFAKPTSKGEIRLVIVTSKYDPYTKSVDAGAGNVEAAKGYVSAEDGKIHTDFGIIDPRSGQILYKDPITGKQELKQAEIDPKTGNLLITTSVIDPKTGRIEPSYAQQLTIVDKQNVLSTVAPVLQRASVSPARQVLPPVKTPTPSPIPTPLQSPVRTSSPITSYAQKSSPLTPTMKSPVKPTMAPPEPPKRKIVKIMVIFTKLDPKSKKPDLNTAEVEHLTGILDPNGLIETKYGVIDSNTGNIIITDSAGQKQTRDGYVLTETGQIFINSGAIDPKTGKIDQNLGMILSVAKQEDPVVEITTITGPIDPRTGKVDIEKGIVEHTKGKVDAETGHISTKYGVIDPSNGVIFVTDTSDTKPVHIDENNGLITIKGVVDPKTGKPDPNVGQVIVVGTHIDPVVEVTTFVGKLDTKKGLIEPKHSLVESSTGQINPDNNKIDTKYGQIDLVKGTVTYNDPKTGKFESRELKVDPVTGQFLLKTGQCHPKSGKPDKDVARMICLRIIKNKIDPVSGKQIVSNDPKNVKVDPKTNQIWIAGPKDPVSGDVIYTAGQVDPTTGYIITIYGRLDTKTGTIIRTHDFDKTLIKVDPVNGQIYTATGEVDADNHPLYSASQVDPSTGEIYTKLGKIDPQTGRLIIIKIFIITQKDDKGRVKEVDPKECTIDETTGRIITTKTVYLYQIIDPITGETIDVDPDDPRLKGARTTVTQTMTLSGKIDPVTGRIKTEYGDIDPDTGDIDPSTAVRDPVTGQLILHYSQIDPSHFEDKSGDYTIEKETQDLPANIDIQTVNTHKFSTFGKDESPLRGDEPKTFTEYTTSEHIRHQGYVSSTTPLSSKIPVSQRSKKTPTPPVVVKTTTKQLLTRNDEGVTHNVEQEVENLGTGEVTFSTHTNKAESIEPMEGPGKSPYVTARAVTTRTATTHHDLDTKAKTQQMEEKTVAHTLTSSATRQEQRVLTQEVKTMVTTGDQEPGAYKTTTTTSVTGNAPFGSMVLGASTRTSTGPIVTEPVEPDETTETQEETVSADGEVVSSQTISSKTRTVETITYKTERNGVIETRVEQKITIQSDGDPIDHDRALAEAIQEATAMNPDMTVEKIEIQQQSTQP